jgi:signal transduction histidine kinase
LLALARSPTPSTWQQLRGDPGAVLLLVRQAADVLRVPGWSFFPALLADPGACEGAVWHLDHSPACFVDWGQGPARVVHQACLATARLACHLASRTGRCDPENAWVAGLLAGLGWLAVCAIDPDRAAACLADPALPRYPARTQKRHWGLDHAAIARRLARRWRLPDWLAGVVGRLGLPAEIAVSLGAEADLFRTVQLAVALSQRSGGGLHLVVGTDPLDAAAALGLPAETLDTLQHEAAALPGTEPPTIGEVGGPSWEAPARWPLLRELLGLAAENRRLRGTLGLERLETEVDELHQALEQQCAGEAERLQARKLAALAEFAAGAGHEINNPLAVISGQAQYLLRNAERGPRTNEEALGPDSLLVHRPSFIASCRTIIEQAQRIHGVLRDLWHFARPPQPNKQPVDLPGLIEEVGASLSELAAQRQVQLVYDRPGPAGRPPSLTVRADPGQLRIALGCLLRNAIEAAPAGGWAAVRLQETPDQVEVLVEDNGPPPGLPQREHLFDPFYSGRAAGRGKGLGLPTAWRLARVHGGDVRFVGLPGEPTRFVLSLPREVSGNGTTNAER